MRSKRKISGKKRPKKQEAERMQCCVTSSTFPLTNIVHSFNLRVLLCAFNLYRLNAILSCCLHSPTTPFNYFCCQRMFLRHDHYSCTRVSVHTRQLMLEYDETQQHKYLLGFKEPFQFLSNLQSGGNHRPKVAKKKGWVEPFVLRWRVKTLILSLSKEEKHLCTEH